MLAASVWGVLGFLRPEYSVIQSLRDEKQKYEEALNNANQVRILRQNLLATYDSFSPENLRRLQIMLPDRADGVQLARDMTNLALVFGITIDSFSFHETAAGALATEAVSAETSAPSALPSAPSLSTGTLELVISFKASYPDFMRFTRELEKSLELSDVVAISIGGNAKADTKVDTQSVDTKPAASNSEENRYQFSVTVHTYFLK